MSSPQPKPKRALYAEYCRDGYQVLDDEGEVLYVAGNNPQTDDPSQNLGLGAVPLRTLRRWSVKTGREIAEELGAVFLGTERISEAAA